MKLSHEDLTNELKAKNIRPSHQRLKVLEYLSGHLTHPSVDQIYTALHKEVPTLSKTTVYSTLNVLAAAGLVRVVNIGDNETRYDINVEEHGHFKCEGCGTIYDFSLDTGSLKTDGLERFEIRDKHVYFKGLCPKCLTGRNEYRSDRPAIRADINKLK